MDAGLLLTLGVIGMTVLGVLHALAARLRDELEIHELHAHVQRLRSEYAQQLQDSEEYIAVEVIEP